MNLNNVKTMLVGCLIMIINNYGYMWDMEIFSKEMWRVMIK